MSDFKAPSGPSLAKRAIPVRKLEAKRKPSTATSVRQSHGSHLCPGEDGFEKEAFELMLGISAGWPAGLKYGGIVFFGRPGVKDGGELVSARTAESRRTDCQRLVSGAG